MTTAVGFSRSTWDASRVGSTALRSILDAMGAMEPERANGLLKEAGLERIRFAIPPSATDGGITHAEIAKFYAVLHTRVGETLARSFLTTQGRLITDRLKSDPTFVVVRAEAQAIAVPAERLVWAVRAAAQLLSEPGNVVEVEESPDELRLTRAHCSVCDRLPSARAPFCASVEEVLTGLIRELAGVRATAIEYECHAVGGERCRYRVRR